MRALAAVLLAAVAGAGAAGRAPAACVGRPSSTPPARLQETGGRSSQARRGGEGHADARSELERAARLRRGLASARGGERDALRARVLAAYHGIVARHGAEREVAAEACFRAGELLRAAGESARAREEFGRAHELGAGTDWRARAGLELGHLARRAHHDEEALQHYRAVLSDHSSAPSRRDEALLWAGRCCAALGRADRAHELWERLASEAEDPCERVAAHDELALAWVEAGDLEAAAGELQRCRLAVGERAMEETPLGERVRSALKRMRAITRLRKAIAERAAGVVIER